MVTLLWKGDVFKISGQEMIKGMKEGGVGKAMGYLSELVVPIIENTPDEEDLREGMEEVSDFTFLELKLFFEVLMLSIFFLSSLLSCFVTTLTFLELEMIL